jgi:TonB-dependent receptor
VDGRYAYGFFIDPTKLRAAVDTLAGRNLLSPATAADDRFRSLAGSSEIEETIEAGYIQGQFTWGRLTALAGVRAEKSEITVDGFNATVEPRFGDYTSATPFTSQSDEVQLLPSVHLRFDATKNLLYRASITQSLARPSFSRLNPSRIVDDSALTVSFGDVNLKTVESTNFDVSADYYFGRTGYVSVGLFAKDMKNNVYTERTIITNPAAIGLAPSVLGYDLSRPRNAKGSEVTGIELSGEYLLTFLPAPFDGFGVGANYTYTDSEIDLGFPVAGVGKLPLFDQVPHTINASIFYDKSGFRARASLLYRDATFFSVDAANNVLSRYQAASTTLDLTASYKFMKHWTVFGEISNVLNTPTRAYNTKESLRLDYSEFTDLSAQVGIRWNW